MWIKAISGKRLVGILSIILALAVIMGVLAGNSVFTSSQSRRLPVYAVKTDEKRIAITFDAAWGNEDTGELIDILQKHNAKATFFIVGNWAERFPESVRALYDAGHIIANHSYSHKAFSECDRNEIKTEIGECNRVLEDITGSPVTLIRAPSGDYTDKSLEVCNEMGMTMIQWDVDSLDYTKISVEEIVDRVIKGVDKGSIVLFHNGVENTAEALDIILTQLKKDGYEFVSVNDLIYKEDFYIDHTGRQHKNS